MCNRVPDTSSWRLKADQAFVNLTSAAPRALWLYELSDDCVRCPYARWCELPAASEAEADGGAGGHSRPYIVKIDTALGQRWRLYGEDVGPLAFENSTAIASIDHPNVGPFGVYSLHCDDGGCKFGELEPARDENIAILYFILIIMALVCTISGSNYLLARYRRRRQAAAAAAAQQPDDELSSAASPTPPVSTPSSTQHLLTDPIQSTPSPPAAKQRLRSLDTFRGMAIVLMIFVNSGGGHFWWMEHATWNGLHVADVVFPCFLWIMGVCIPMSVRGQRARGVPRRRMVAQVAVRSVKLFLIGLFLNTIDGPAFGDIRIMGVLQRFGIAYFAIATLYILLHRNIDDTTPVDVNSSRWARWRYAMRDVEQLWPLWLSMATIVVLQFGLLFGLPVDGCPSGYLGPGGRHDAAAHWNCTGGASGAIDRLLLGERHLYQWAESRRVYSSQTLDPEGLFGCLLTVVQVFFGLQCGCTLATFRAPAARLWRWSAWAVATGVLGGALAGFSQDDGWIPVNKHLWSASFVLVTTAVAYGMLALCYVVCDVWRQWSGAPFRWAGMNAIVLYVGHMVLHRALPFRWWVGEMNEHLVLLVANGWTAGLWVAVAWWMWRRKLFVSV